MRISVLSFAALVSATPLLAQQGKPEAWLVATAKVGHLQTLTGHADWARTVSFTPDGETLISGGSASKVKLWSMPDGKLLTTFKAHG